MTSESVYSGCQKSEALACETVESDCPPLQRVSCESIASSTSLERQLIRAAADVVLKAARDHWGKLSMSGNLQVVVGAKVFHNKCSRRCYSEIPQIIFNCSTDIPFIIRLSRVFSIM